MSGRFANQLIQWSLLEYRNAQNLQKSVKRDRQRQLLLDDRHKDINRDGYPDLCLHGVFGGSVKGLDPKVLFDPAEEQLDLPTALIKQGDGQSRKGEVVGQERKISVIVPVVKPNATKAIRVVLSSIESAEDDRLIRA